MDLTTGSSFCESKFKHFGFPYLTMHELKRYLLFYCIIRMFSCLFYLQKFGKSISILHKTTNILDKNCLHIFFPSDAYCV